ncbi:hypothetical protein RFI_22114 [Reticulomyxa filosa]|uniref:Uncharacterized protein n=1 Tax=Reticulomyxa filosa TaxID=46433 RepID=X6MQ77_RETFI|nr:hypothetical protein RFI_22114 [Reticulomyxa filosa]|eukprot:ETO15250.1 hypothetical protein RFI_22114 [Reticulomyxa filosa]
MFKCKNTNSWSLSIDIPSKQLKVEYEELHNWMTMVQALVAKAKIDAIQNEAFYSRDEPANQIYFHELNFANFVNINCPNLFKAPKTLIENIRNIELNALNVNINKKELYASSTNKWDHNVFKVSFSAKKTQFF